MTIQMNIKIRNIEIACGSHKVTNSYFLDYFKEQGKNIDHLLKGFGKKERR